MGRKKYSKEELQKMADAEGISVVGIKRKLGLYGKKTVKQKGTSKGKKPSPVRLLTHKGVTLPVTSWEKIKGISAKVLVIRMDAGWPEEIIFEPTDPRNDEESMVSNNREAWGNLDADQLETMREFEQLGSIARWE